MNKWRFVVLVFALALAAFGLPASATLAQTEVHRFHGNLATAYFSESEGQCIATSVEVQVTEGKIAYESGPLTPVSQVYVTIFKYDLCNQTLLLYVSGVASLPDRAFEADPQLDSAKLDATVNVCGGQPQACVDVSLHLTWTGMGDITRRNVESRSRSPSCLVDLHLDDSRRRAAVSGSVSSQELSLSPAMTTIADLRIIHNGRLVSSGTNCPQSGPGAGGFPF
jgi:hypothetical protein